MQEYGGTAYGWAMEDTTSLCKLIADPATGQLLGAHIMGEQASTLIQPLIQAMSFGLGVREMARGQYWIHPALTEVVENALLEARALIVTRRLVGSAARGQLRRHHARHQHRGARRCRSSSRWPSGSDERIVYVPRGISRHVVRFVDVGGEVFAIKEATDRFVLREHALLRALAEHSVPVVDAYGTVVERTTDDGEELGGLLITRHLPFSQPYRSLFTGRSLPQLRIRLLDALAGLFVRLHLAGFYWGDCSLSNTLFRRDAGALAAYLVDAETGELHAAADRRPARVRHRDRDDEHRRRAVRPAGRRAASTRTSTSPSSPASRSRATSRCGTS